MGRTAKFLITMSVLFSLTVQLYGLAITIESPRMRLSFIGHPSYWQMMEGQTMLAYGRTLDPPELMIEEGTHITIDGTKFPLEDTYISGHHFALYSRLPIIYHPGGRTALIGGFQLFGEALHTLLAGVSQTLEYGKFEISGFIGAGFHRYTAGTSAEVEAGEEIMDKKYDEEKLVKGRITSWASPALWWGGDISYALSEQASLMLLVSKVEGTEFSSGTFRIDGHDRRRFADFSREAEIQQNYQISLGMSFTL